MELNQWPLQVDGFPVIAAGVFGVFLFIFIVMMIVLLPYLGDAWFQLFEKMARQRFPQPPLIVPLPPPPRPMIQVLPPVPPQFIPLAAQRPPLPR